MPVQLRLLFIEKLLERFSGSDAGKALGLLLKFHHRYAAGAFCRFQTPAGRRPVHPRIGDRTAGRFVSTPLFREGPCAGDHSSSTPSPTAISLMTLTTSPTDDFCCTERIKTSPRYSRGVLGLGRMPSHPSTMLSRNFA